MKKILQHKFIKRKLKNSQLEQQRKKKYPVYIKNIGNKFEFKMLESFIKKI